MHSLNLLQLICVIVSIKWKWNVVQKLIKCLCYSYSSIYTVCRFREPVERTPFQNTNIHTHTTQTYKYFYLEWKNETNEPNVRQYMIKGKQRRWPPNTEPFQQKHRLHDEKRQRAWQWLLTKRERYSNIALVL